MADIITKATDNAIQVEKTVSTVQYNTIEFDDLLKQEQEIKNAKIAAVASYDAQLVEVRELIAQAKALGVKSRVARIATALEKEPV